jgi:flavin-dependent dehydrogenase
MNFDAIIVGGGPAGSTLAGMLLKYRPESRVLVLERAHFPRFHVGETLVTELNRTLQELGVYEQLVGSDFIRKMGDTFVAKRDIDPAHRGSLNRYILWIAQSLVDRDLATCITPSADAT